MSPISTVNELSRWLYAYTLTAMEEVQKVVAEARARSGLSIRELARLAGVSFTTVARIESGDVDPSVGTVRKIVAAAGRELRITTEPSKSRLVTLAALAGAVTTSRAGERPDWTRLRAFLDRLALEPDQVEAAITSRPHPRSRLMDALLAAMAEKLADDSGLPRPGWTRTAPKMRPEWVAPGTPRMQAEFRRRAPKQLLERGFVIDEQSLWRDRATVGL
jgi:transcriptional regulator with XRE-family HTH domain